MKELMAKSLMNQKLNQDDGVTEQCVNQSGTAENGSEHAACQAKGSGESCDHLVV